LFEIGVARRWLRNAPLLVALIEIRLILLGLVLFIASAFLPSLQLLHSERSADVNGIDGRVSPIGQARRTTRHLMARVDCRRIGDRRVRFLHGLTPLGIK
jgi:hypothetical protein